jgi:predicted phosphodiesterase
MRRLGLIGDVHAEDVLLAAALERLAHQELDGILCAGDIADGRGDIDRCVELLLRSRVAAVRGNHDRWCVAGEMRDLHAATPTEALAESTRQYLTQLPSTRRFETVAGPLVLAHGLGKQDMLRVGDRLSLAYHIETVPQLRADRRLGLDADMRIHVGGHTHQRWAEQIGALTMINAGTLRAGDTPCFGVLDLGEGYVQWFDLDEDGTVAESERVVFR